MITVAIFPLSQITEVDPIPEKVLSFATETMFTLWLATEHDTQKYWLQVLVPA